MMRYKKSFKEPISDLLNPYSGHPYSDAWQKKIAAMRELYIAYQMSLGDTKKHINEVKRTKRL